ncbi:MAG: HlyD family efflux transporter periplasmic adaptor subunit [Magnetococcales bacterium]|nr:HlyD family efflux transporter periplasmic adaptor subunit [Magnetococcales bacterium]
MIFHSLDFLIFFLPVLAVYWLLRARKPQNLFLLVVSYYFYGYIHPWFLYLIFASTVVDFSCGLAIAQGEPFIRLYAPEAARLEKIRTVIPGSVHAGEPLFELVSPDLKRQKKLARVRQANSEWEMAVAGLHTEWARRARIAREEKNRSASTLAGLEANEQRLILTAPATGLITDVPPDLAEGTWLGTGAHLATLVDLTHLTVEAYLEEDALGRVHAGARGRFIPAVAEYSPVAVHLERLDVSPVPQLDEPLLYAQSGGPITVRMQNNVAVPEGALFRIRLAADEIPLWAHWRLRGTLHLDAEPRSLLERWWRSLLMVLVREWEM